MTKGKVGLIVIPLSLVSLVFLYAYYQTRERISCGEILSETKGVYTDLAKLDGEGYLYPVGKLDLDNGSNWRMVLKYYENTYNTNDIEKIKFFKDIRFYCTNSDSGTPEISLSIYRENDLVYRSQIHNDGLQNQDIGYAPAYNRIEFMFHLISLMNANE